MTPTSGLRCSRFGGAPPWAAPAAKEVPGAQGKSPGSDLFLPEVTALPFVHSFHLGCVFPSTLSPLMPPPPAVTPLWPCPRALFPLCSLRPSTPSPAHTRAAICPHVPAQFRVFSRCHTESGESLWCLPRSDRLLSLSTMLSESIRAAEQGRTFSFSWPSNLPLRSCPEVVLSTL